MSNRPPPTLEPVNHHREGEVNGTAHRRGNLTCGEIRQLYRGSDRVQRHARASRRHPADHGRHAAPRPPRHLRLRTADAAIFERAYAPAAKTPSSVVSALTGLYPWQHRVRLFYQLLADDRRLVSELLPDEYQTAAFVSSTVLTEEALGIAGRFDHYDDFVDERLIELCLEDPDPGGHPEFHDHGSRITDPKVSPRADERAVEKLRSLGYVD